MPENFYNVFGYPTSEIGGGAHPEIPNYTGPSLRGKRSFSVMDAIGARDRGGYRMSGALDPKTGMRLSNVEAMRRGPFHSSGWKTSGVGPGTAGYRGSYYGGGYNYGEGTKRPESEISGAKTSSQYYAARDAKEGNPLINLQMGNRNLMQDLLRRSMNEGGGIPSVNGMAPNGLGMVTRTNADGSISGMPDWGGGSAQVSQSLPSLSPTPEDQVIGDDGSIYYQNNGFRSIATPGGRQLFDAQGNMIGSSVLNPGALEASEFRAVGDEDEPVLQNVHGAYAPVPRTADPSSVPLINEPNLRAMAGGPVEKMNRSFYTEEANSLRPQPSTTEQEAERLSFLPQPGFGVTPPGYNHPLDYALRYKHDWNALRELRAKEEAELADRLAETAPRKPYIPSGENLSPPSRDVRTSVQKSDDAIRGGIRAILTGYGRATGGAMSGLGEASKAYAKVAKYPSDVLYGGLRSIYDTFFTPSPYAK